MQKQELIDALARALVSGDITKEELLALTASNGVSEKRELGVAHVLYYIGGTIVFLGFAVFVSTEWEHLESYLRILLTLGAGIAFYVSAALLARDERIGHLPDALHLAGGLLIPAGVFITLDELGFQGGEWGPGIIFLAFTGMYVASHLFYRRTLLLIFSIIFGTIAFIFFTEAMVAGAVPVFDEFRFAMYRLLAVGAAYVAFARAWRGTSRAALCGVLYGIGTFGVLGATLALGEWKPEETIPRLWEVIYPGLAFGAMFLSLWLRSRSMLVCSALFVVGYIAKITGEYFAESAGWPLALMLIGFALIGMGYLVVHLNRKYFAVTAR